MEKYLITGGAGFIGSNLADKLIEEGKEVLIIDNLSSGKKENINKKTSFFNLDICDFEKILPVFRDVDYVFHLAAIPRVPVSILDPIGTSKTNILGTINVFKAASDNNVKRVVFASSSSVYGNQSRLPLREDMIPDPISPYGLQKLAGEKFAWLFFKLYGTSIVSLRYFNVYGPRINPDSEYSSVLGKFLKQKAKGEPLTVFGSGEQTRGFCYISDIVQANLKAMKSSELKGGEVINAGSEDSNSVNFLAELVGGEVKYLEKREGDIEHSKADISQAKELLGWHPEVSFEEGVKRTVEWFSQRSQ
ncbi:MAG: hypothetical protein A2365_00475 [Candidatus Nealsonbacteria bacterium RIFOXYB1_FULL_40_15]|uniref:NAD-dependent epimerase/dehydratase domain-containing protein n=2 Tax=Candidatus Nealsoniibacteriota TaxID=1817911 RepID=A0A1G2ESG5_9BACT|nr:MAG: hypothetical protein A2365_00475 [Candidatus Nealsonbacteria bacterium RIFOXYB1_FULL_40_15]OGZ28746.1 MAG: hypothetical protein A2427_01655 [Candidatus Nealsonbacteria bacterium RIFOXYC1_FULL_40_7]OGZ29024.1 MAG: hypothetical protein A2562_00905 [Candidatus Nealsonbacteria bacterium RIFOXYD1_FULL_39_11]